MSPNGCRLRLGPKHRNTQLTIVAVNGMLSIKDDAKAETHTISTMAAAKR